MQKKMQKRRIEYGIIFDVNIDKYENLKLDWFSN
jgi:hypothetical protein